MNDRDYWFTIARDLVCAPFDSLKKGSFVQDLPIRGECTTERYEKTTYLECISRTLVGVAPLIESESFEILGFDTKELIRTLEVHFNPNSKLYLNFSEGTQPLVECAFLAIAFLRAPTKLWGELSVEFQRYCLEIFKASRKIKPHYNNWLLFSAAIEAFLFKVGEDFDPMRVDYALRQHDNWYLGDGVYSDGDKFRLDYYNSYVIHPFLLEISKTIKGYNYEWDQLGRKFFSRAQRHAVQLERLIAVDGSFPPLGRSLAYRAAAFHLLSYLAYNGDLPSSLPANQVRSALTQVIRKTLESNGNYDENGWLRVGLNGDQANLGENYISTGSLYLTSVIFMPLGLGENHEFWSGGETLWTQKKLWWLQENMVADKAVD